MFKKKTHNNENAISIINSEIKELLYEFNNIKDKSENFSRIHKLVFTIKILRKIIKKLE